MAFGVLPPYSPLLITKAFFDALCTMDDARITFAGIPSMPTNYVCAVHAIKADDDECLCVDDFCILGSAANNRLTVPSQVGNAYLHAIQVIQNIAFGYSWPYSRSDVHLLLDDEEHNALITLFGLMYDLPNALQCLEKMRTAGPCEDGSTSWETEAIGVLHPYIEKLSYSLGQIIRDDCICGTSEANSPERYAKVLSYYEQAFVHSSMRG